MKHKILKRFLRLIVITCIVFFVIIFVYSNLRYSARWYSTPSNWPIALLCASVSKGNYRQVVFISKLFPSTINKKDYYGYTPLSFSVSRNSSSIISYLLSAGAKPNVFNGSDKDTALQESIERNNLTYVRLLLLHKADPNLSSFFKNTPINISIKNKNSLILQELIDHGVNMYYTDYFNELPLNFACDIGDTKNVNILLNNGADVRRTNQSKQSAIFFVSNDDIMMSLLKKGASFHCYDDSGCTPLHVAVIDDNYTRVKLYLKYGENVNEKNLDYGWTALHYVESIKMAKLLLSYGADTTIVSNNGKTPAMHARENNKIDIAKLLATYQKPK